MKKEGHPPYQEVLFVDSSTGFKFVCGSTLQPKRKTFLKEKNIQYTKYLYLPLLIRSLQRASSLLTRKEELISSLSAMLKSLSQ
jgi:hypothetical protein